MFRQMKYPVYKQLSVMDCGLCCLRMILAFFDIKVDTESLRNLCPPSREGVSMFNMAVAAEKIGFKAEGIITDIASLKKNFSTPCILHWNNNHFVVLYKILSKKGRNYYKIGNPAFGSVITLNENEFVLGWCGRGNNELIGYALLLSFKGGISKNRVPSSSGHKVVIGRRIIGYVIEHKKSLLGVCIIVAFASAIQLIFPFTSQCIVDKGIALKNINIVITILFGQLFLMFGQTTCGFIRSWVLLKVGTDINIHLLSDYLSKLMSLPIAFFDTKFAGDIMQRINDHYRIQYFLTDNFIDTLFSLLNILIFGTLLIYYNVSIAIIFVFGSLLYICWIMVFMKKRENIDHRMFSFHSLNQNNLMQLIYGMQEIKLNTCEAKKLKEWKSIQSNIKDWSLKRLKISQYQQSGCIFINRMKDVVITAWVACLVIEGELSLGVMLSIQYIIGVLNSPVSQLAGSIRQFQDARLSIDRLSDVYLFKSEDENCVGGVSEACTNCDIIVDDVSFKYDKTDNANILEHLSIRISKGQTTAIVGLSGSGKTTLMKLLLGFYTPDSGRIKIGDKDLGSINKRDWRKRCGIVMQDGYIFSDTIENNITMGCGHIDYTRLHKVCKMANIERFINNLPLGYKTVIGNDGKGISNGQKQRLLIARALYKNPEYLFMDEATNSLDTENESLIANQLEAEFKGKTVVIIAHRLSTIKNADKIVLLKDGRIAEIGSHPELMQKKGFYYSLVEKQVKI